MGAEKGFAISLCGRCLDDRTTPPHFCFVIEKAGRQIPFRMMHDLYLHINNRVRNLRRVDIAET